MNKQEDRAQINQNFYKKKGIVEIDVYKYLIYENRTIIKFRYIQNLKKIMGKIRKNYSNTTENEKTRYWNCLKMLNLMAADDPVSFNNPRRWVNNYDLKKQNPDQQGESLQVQVICRTKYDEVVSIHSTSCQHSTNLFPHFHRNYISYVQMFLSKADRILRKLDSKTQLTFDREHKDYKELFQTAQKDHIEVVNKIAQENNGNIPQISIPHWDILDASKEIVIPKLLRNPELNTSSLDILYERQTGAPIGFFNPSKRWMDSEQAKKIIGKQNKRQLFYRTYVGLGQELQDVPQNPQLDSQTDRILKNGVTQKDLYNMRHTKQIKEGQQIPISKDLNKQFDDYHFDRIINHYDQVQGDKYKYCEYIPLNPLQDNVINYMYGNKPFGYEDINSLPTDEKYKDSQAQNKQNFNLLRSSYIYGLSLINPDVYSGKWEGDIFQKQAGFFCKNSAVHKYTKSFEEIHNILHNRLGFSMRHTSYSVINPLFFIYHSTIDFMLELKMRMVRSNYKFDNQDLNLADNIQQHTMQQLERFFNTDLDSDFIENQLGWYNGSLKYKIYKAQQAKKFKDIKIIDWTNGVKSKSKYISLEDFSDSGFTYHDYMIINKDGKRVLRLSNEMNEIFKKSRYHHYYPQFDWDYEYEQLTQEAVKKRGNLIPQYLLKVVNTLAPTIKQNRQLILEQAGFVHKQKLPIDRVKQLTSQMQKGSITNCFNKDKATQILKAYAERIQYLLKTQVYRMTYSSKIRSQQVILYLSLKKQFKNKYTSDELIKEFNGVFMVNDLAIFSKQSDAVACPKCTQCKHQFLKLSNNLTGCLRNLYLDIANQTQPGIIYNNLNEANFQEQNPLENIVRFFTNKADKNMVVAPVLGAQSVKFNLVMCSQLPKFIWKDKNCYYLENLDHADPLSDEYSWRFSITSESVSLIDLDDTQSFISYTRDDRSFNNKQYDFPQISYRKNKGKSDERTVRYLHKKINGQVQISKPGKDLIVKQFSFEFKNLRRDATYYFYVSAKGDIVVLNKETFDYRVLIECADMYWNH